ALSDVGRYGSVLRVAAEAKQPQPGHENDPGHRVELALVSSRGSVVAREIGAVIGREALDRLAGPNREAIEMAPFRRLQDQRVILGADRVVGGGNAGEPVALQLRAADKIAPPRPAAELEHDAPVEP